MRFLRELLSNRDARPRITPNAVLAVLVVAVVSLMVLPLPTWLLDILLAANLATSVSILLVTLYVSDALKVASFPTLLLITTLIRLALNVSSTRLILLQADAGRVISAFGQFVVSGNYVVGAVVFLILSLIQFVVIAKGSERVAEVGARFALDAMPGKQMAIDAELRAGSIDAATAQRRRHSLSRESQFYGAMDGAMKFVKGDVVASFIITLVNIVAGLTIGIAQRGMQWADALKRYGLLTIGDGLISQIPSLLLATAAGMLVTRVASENSKTALGEELSAQLFSSPRALRVSAAFAFALGLIPGLPAFPFVLIGGLLWLSTRGRVEESLSGSGAGLDPEPASRLPPTWSLTCSPGLDQRLAGGASAGLSSAAEWAREDLFQRLGVILPRCHIELRGSVPEPEVVLSVREVPTSRSELLPGLEGEAAARAVAQSIAAELRVRAQDFMGLQQAQQLLEEVSKVSAASVEQVVPKLVSLPRLTEILRRLVEEGVSVRDMASILEALAQVADSEKDALVLAEHIRSWLRRAITFDVTEGTGLLEPLTLDESIEEAIRASITHTNLGAYLTLSPAAGRDIVAALERALQRCSDRLRSRPVVLTQPDIRRFVRKLLEGELPSVRVVTFAELLPDTKVKAAAVASLADL